MSSRRTLQRSRSSYHYQTFPNVAPPASRGRPPSQHHHWKGGGHPGRQGPGSSSSLHSSRDGGQDSTPIPRRQLIILAIISLAEQTALNSISPYLPQMAATFPEVGVGNVGLYVGIIASSFAAAQFATNIFWGRLSDRIGVGCSTPCFVSICYCGFSVKNGY